MRTRKFAPVRMMVGLTKLDSRTVKVQPKQADQELQSAAHKNWRQAVLEQAGFRCQAIERGRRCQVQAPARLFADHITERRDGGAHLDVGNGQCLCGRHHTLKTARARALRLVSRA